MAPRSPEPRPRSRRPADAGATVQPTSKRRCAGPASPFSASDSRSILKSGRPKHGCISHRRRKAVPPVSGSPALHGGAGSRQWCRCVRCARGRRRQRWWSLHCRHVRFNARPWPEGLVQALIISRGPCRGSSVPVCSGAVQPQVAAVERPKQPVRGPRGPRPARPDIVASARRCLLVEPWCLSTRIFGGRRVRLPPAGQGDRATSSPGRSVSEFAARNTDHQEATRRANVNCLKTPARPCATARPQPCGRPADTRNERTIPRIRDGRRSRTGPSDGAPRVRRRRTAASFSGPPGGEHRAEPWAGRPVVDGLVPCPEAPGLRHVRQLLACEAARLEPVILTGFLATGLDQPPIRLTHDEASRSAYSSALICSRSLARLQPSGLHRMMPPQARASVSVRYFSSPAWRRKPFRSREVKEARPGNGPLATRAAPSASAAPRCRAGGSEAVNLETVDCSKFPGSAARNS